MVFFLLRHTLIIESFHYDDIMYKTRRFIYFYNQ